MTRWHPAAFRAPEMLSCTSAGRPPAADDAAGGGRILSNWTLPPLKVLAETGAGDARSWSDE
jgi:hypothetical protein